MCNMYMYMSSSCCYKMASRHPSPSLSPRPLQPAETVGILGWHWLADPPAALYTYDLLVRPTRATYLYDLLPLSTCSGSRTSGQSSMRLVSARSPSTICVATYAPIVMRIGLVASTAPTSAAVCFVVSASGTAAASCPHTVLGRDGVGPLLHAEDRRDLVDGVAVLLVRRRIINSIAESTLSGIMPAPSGIFLRGPSSPASTEGCCRGCRL